MRALPRLLFVVCLLSIGLAPTLCLGQLENGPWCKFMGTASNGTSSAPGGTGKVVRWSQAWAANPIGSAVVGSNNVVYICAPNGYTYAYDGSEGTLLWTNKQALGINSTPAIGADGTVYVGDSTIGVVYAINGTTGAIEWEASTYAGADTGISSSPTIGPDGTLYVGCDDGNLYAFDTTTRQIKFAFATGGAIKAPPVFDNGLVCFGSMDTYFYAVDPSKSQTAAWKYRAPELATISTSAAVDSSGNLYVIDDSGALLSLTDAGVLRWVGALNSYAHQTPVIRGYHVYVVGDVQPNHSDVLLELDSQTGQSVSPFSELPSGDAYTSSPSVASDGTLYIGTMEGYLVTADVTAPTVTAHEFALQHGEIDTAPAIGADGAVYLAGNLGALFAIDNNSVKNAYGYPAQTVGGTGTRGVVQLGGKAGPNGAVVTLSSTTLGVPATVTVPANSTGVSFAITTPAVAAPTTATFEATLYKTNFTATLTLEPSPISKIYASPSSILGGAATRGVVQLDNAAVGSGDVVSLQSSSADLSVPASITVPSGSKGISFALSSSLVSSQENVILTATLGSSTQETTVDLNPYPLSRFYTAVNSLTQGGSTTGVVQVSGPAGPTGDVVSVGSSDPSVSVPGTITIPSGTKGVSFKITTSPVSSSINVTLSASFAGSSETTSLTVNPATISNFYTSPSSIVGGTGSRGVIQLSGKAGPAGDVISLQSMDAHVVLPATVTIPAGSTGVSFAISTQAVTSSTQVTIEASFGASSSQTTITLNPPG